MWCVGASGASVSPVLSLVRVDAESTPEILTMEGSVLPTDATVEAETACFNRSQNNNGLDAWLEQELRYMMSQKAEEGFSLETDVRVDQLREDLPRFRRAEETRMLQEEKNPSRWCEMGESCESVRLSRVYGVHPPIRLASVRKERCDHRQCLMCLRNLATMQLLRLRMDRCGMVREGCLQSHGNYVNVRGEYRAEDCLPVRSGKCVPRVLLLCARP